MSGPICPDCSSFEIESKSKREDKCKFCGWIGEKLPRKIVSSEGLREMGNSQRDDRKLRENNQLFFLRIYCNSENAFDFVSEYIDEIFNLADSYTYTDKYLFYRLSTKPSKEIISKIRKIKGVKKVSLF
jgi:hypothetical protein